MVFFVTTQRQAISKIIAVLMSFFLLPSIDRCAEGSSQYPPPHNGTHPVATLSNGLSLPLVGLGCASGVRYQHVANALRLGYRFFDTAQSYNWGYHEDEVGDALFGAGGSSSSTDEAGEGANIIVQTKIHPQDLGYRSTQRAVAVSLERLKRTSLDSVLIHKPRCWGDICAREPEGTWADSWEALQDLVDRGVVRSIGICDVDDSLLDALLKMRIRPHVIQNWMDPFHQDQHIRRRCQEEGILYQAYSSLGTQWKHHRGIKPNPVLNDPTLRRIADAHGVSVGNVVINWATRLGMSVLPASTNEGRQKSNLHDSFTFDLTDEEMASIEALDGNAPKPPKKDRNEVEIRFHNRGEDAIESYWVSDTNELHPVGRIKPNGSVSFTTYHGHQFVFKSGNGEEGVIVGQHRVERANGLKQSHVVQGGEL